MERCGHTAVPCLCRSQEKLVSVGTVTSCSVQRCEVESCSTQTRFQLFSRKRRLFRQNIAGETASRRICRAGRSAHRKFWLIHQRFGLSQSARSTTSACCSTRCPFNSTEASRQGVRAPSVPTYSSSIPNSGSRFRQYRRRCARRKARARHKVCCPKPQKNRWHRSRSSHLVILVTLAYHLQHRSVLLQRDRSPFVSPQVPSSPYNFHRDLHPLHLHHHPVFDPAPSSPVVRTTSGLSPALHLAGKQRFKTFEHRHAANRRHGVHIIIATAAAASRHGRSRCCSTETHRGPLCLHTAHGRRLPDCRLQSSPRHHQGRPFGSRRLYLHPLLGRSCVGAVWM